MTSRKNERLNVIRTIRIWEGINAAVAEIQSPLISTQLLPTSSNMTNPTPTLDEIAGGQPILTSVHSSTLSKSLAHYILKRDVLTLSQFIHSKHYPVIFRRPNQVSNG
jgi:hypothetical protein